MPPAATFEWRFQAPPDAVWRLVADTARFNEAARLMKYRVREAPEPDGSVRFLAEARIGPLRLAWEDLPVEWVAGRWFRHPRRFLSGPIARMTAAAALVPEAGGTRLRYTVDAEPAGPLGRILLATGFFAQVRRRFGPLMASADAFLDGHAPEPFPLPRVAPAPGARGRLAAAVRRIEASGNGHGRAQRLADWLLSAPEIDAARIRPLALAGTWGAPPREVVELCLQATAEGVLELSWDLLCPRCRGAKLSAPALDRLPRGAHCPACNIAYDRDFTRNVELTFHPAAAIRPIAAGEFCLFGPMTTPHVEAQLVLEPGGCRDEPAAFAPGPYRVRTLEPGGEAAVEHRGGAFPSIEIAADAVTLGPAAATGRLVALNRDRRRRVLVVESRAWVRGALTADRATALQAFRDLFATEALRPGDEVAIGRAALMFTDLEGSTALYRRVGDAAAYRMVREHFAALAAAVRRHDGGIVKTIGDAIMAVFPEPEAALAAALDVHQAMGAFAPVRIKVGLHAGACIAVTLNDRLDYFGSTVNMAARLQGESRGGEIVLSEAMLEDPGVRRRLPPGVMAETRGLKGFAEPIRFYRWAISTSSAVASSERL